ncbi:MAG: DUF3021 domain-containing protein [Lachnospiraceae bacterium]|nr:DUF3021 domain-containing protein [Lachnospiraceae bacterium]
MNKAKIIFNQTLMISTAILFGMGIRTAVLYLAAGQYMINWQWYIPLSIVMVGFFCALASLILYDDSDAGRISQRLRICIHFLLVFGIVSLFGYLFDWYSDLPQYLLIVIMYIVIYAFVWISTIWILKADADKINDAIKEIRDEE